MKGILSSIITLFFCVYSLQAQDIKGTLVNTSNEILLTASVSLHHSQDSSVVKYGYVQEDGTFTFVKIPAGNYFLKIEEGGNDMYTASFLHTEDTNTDLSTIQYQPATTELEQVVFRYQRPLIEMKPDGLVFNVDSTINAVGQNGLDLMRKSPGVVVDKDENITMNGKNGIRVYIDGRLSPLQGSELSEYLKTIQSNSIDAIEIIANPSAKYDAAGNAGVINIKLKKNNLVGTNGSINLGYAIGKFGKYNGGLSLNHRNRKFNFYGNYNIHHGNNWNDVTFERKTLDTFFQQKATMISSNTTHNYKGGIDYFINDKSTVGVMLNGNARVSDMDGKNSTSFIYIPTQTNAQTLQSNNQDASKRNNFNLNLNYQFSDKKSGKSLTIDGDYGYFNIHNDQYQPNSYFNNAGNETHRNVYNLLTATGIDIFTIKTDYEQPLLKGKFAVGAKLTNTQTQNDFKYHIEQNSAWQLDKDRSNLFGYREHIQAVYGQFNKQEKGWAYQVGLRAENTITKGTSNGQRWNGTHYEDYETQNPRNYFNLFPSLGVTLNKNPMNMFNFMYSKRIDRPNYHDLNPFEYKMTDYSFRKGNIHLKPQITNAISVTHTYKYLLNTRLEYAHTTDVFAELVDTINNGKMFQIKENLATQDIVSLNISMPFAYKKFSSFINLNTYYAMFKADYGNGRAVNMDVFAYNLYGQMAYKINDWLSAEVSGWYTSPSIWQGTFRSIAMGGVDAGIQARVLKGKGNLKLSMGDLFNTMKWGGSSNFAAQDVKAYGRWESQQFRINFTYNFGNNKIKTRQRKTASEEESRRAGESHGLQQGR
jgi:iron complex outermembrane receptor protein